MTSPLEDFQELAELAERIAHLAGAHVLSLIGGDNARLALRDTADRKTSATDLVSTADHASEAVIVAQLAIARPRDGIVAEEGSTRPSTSGISWVIDPIDGTTNFLYGHGSFGVSIAAVRDGETIAGVVYDPLRRETYRAARGFGASCNGRKLTIGSPTPLAEVLLGTGFHYLASRRRRQAELLVTILPEVRDIRRQGAAALDLCYVASGRLDAYYEAALQPWDRAAGLLVAQEAGYVGVDLDLGGELDGTLLVAHPDLLEQIRDLIVRANELHR